MPELPEVEIVKRSLEKILTAKTIIVSAEVRRADIRFKIPKDLAKKLKDQIVTKITRRAKYLLFEMQSGILLNHLGMTGSWRILVKGEELGIHDHFCLNLSSSQTLVYRDPRRFGMIDFMPITGASKHVRLKNLGPEPLDKSIFTPEYLFQISRQRQTAIKTFIMDQKIVVGVGNIYASEVLFLAKVNPLKKASRISKRDSENIVNAIFSVLEKAIELGGSTIRDFVSSDGVYGNYQSQFWVYGRDGEQCKICQSSLRSKILNGRSTYWCQSCQK